MFLSSNIKYLRKRKGRTQDDVSFSLKMKRSTLSGYENGVAEPGMDALVAFSNYFNVAIDTLLRVDIQSLSESQMSQLDKGFDVYIKGSNLRVLATTVDSQNNENIELVSEKAKAGYKRGFADPEYISELPVFQLPFLSKNRKYRSFQLNGDSMLPIPDGSWVTAEFLQDWNHIVSGNAYIIFTLEEGLMFKIVDNKMKDEQKLTLYSLNPLYEAYDVHLSEIKEIWKFVHYISEELPDPLLPESKLMNAVVKVKKDIEMLKKQVRN